MVRPAWELGKYEDQVKATGNVELIEEYFYTLGFARALDSCGVYEVQDEDFIEAVKDLLEELKALPM